jgi:hypothetical protein
MGGNGVITTETELAIFDHLKARLSFLVEDEDLKSSRNIPQGLQDRVHRLLQAGASREDIQLP